LEDIEPITVLTDPSWGKPNTRVTSRKVAVLLGRYLVGPLNRQPLIHVQAKQSIGVHVRPDQRCECSLVFCCQLTKPTRLGQNALDHERDGNGLNTSSS
jgi:hypothetical protein